MVYQTVDYVNAFFEFPVLDRIHGEPSYVTLKTLKKQLKSNAKSVVSDLGGGVHGHLGLVLTAQEYALVSPVAYDRPVHPGLLVIPNGTAHHEAVRLRDEHQENIRLFRETINLEQALKKQIVAAVPADYLKELRDETTNTIDMTVAEILAHLYTRYGEVDSNVLDTEEQKVKQYVWNINDPPVHFFNLIEEIVSLATAAGQDKTQAQIVTLGYNIVRNTGDPGFEPALIEWKTRAAADKTWINFKTHIIETYNQLKSIRGTTMRNSPFHQAHQVATNLRHDFNEMKSDIIQAMNSLSTHDDQSPPAETPPSMNATMGTDTTVLLQAIHDLQTKISAMESNQGNQNERKIQRRPRRNVSKYCWSHGACSHAGKDCNNKKSGHKDEATFENKMGGSTYYCNE